ncbi:MAG: nicotinamide-nucleotide amidohydrolase family protein [Clostridiales bacterium]|jgi:nicotinamide-nucleotide amidase|nr:nicotinamide-nucleotide amidohydrolase family protein [Clostridiales bacterium]
MMQTIKLFGLNKSDIEEKLAAFKSAGAEFSVTECDYDAELSISAGESLPKRAFESLLADILDLFREFIYAEGGVKLAELAVMLLLHSKNVLSVAESLTGGALAASIIEYPGVSACFYEGVVAYDNAAKRARLGVTEQTLEKYGAVSAECAREMARGSLTHGCATVALSTTGIAGPGGACPGKPVGTVYIGISDGRNTEAFRHSFDGDRNAVRAASVNAALFYLVKYLRDGMCGLLA